MKTPEVSILVRACNVARFLPFALASIQAQDFQKWEALILDDTSRDAIKKALKPFLSDPRVHYMRNRRRLGRAGNLNRGLSIARGTYIAVLDGDDVWCDSAFLSRHVSYLSRHPGVALTAAGVQEIDEQGEVRRMFPNGWLQDRAIRDHLLIENIISHHTVCYRRKDALELGGYDERLSYTEDYDLWLRLGQRGKLRKFHAVTGSYRIHGLNIGVRNRKHQILEELAVVWRHRSAYPYFGIAMLNRSLSFAASLLPKKARQSIAALVGYHAIRSWCMNGLKFN
jgi:glycosyltransferase involved in cell wall biosynthesis